MPGVPALLAGPTLPTISAVHRIGKPDRALPKVGAVLISP